MDYKKTKAAMSTIPRDLDVLEKETGNVYETVMILAKRANQISSELKEELQHRQSGRGFRKPRTNRDIQIL
jgi:hypothetical protein